MFKKCCACKKSKPLNDFNKNKTTKDGFAYDCKDCRKKYRELNKERLEKYYKEYHKNLSPKQIEQKRKYKKRYGKKYREAVKADKVKYIKTLFYGLKGRADKEGQGWLDFDMQWLVDFASNNEKYSKLHKNWVRNGFLYKYSPSVDRINNNLGYLKTNIQFLTKSENCRKGNRRNCNYKFSNTLKIDESIMPNIIAYSKKQDIPIELLVNKILKSFFT